MRAWWLWCVLMTFFALRHSLFRASINSLWWYCTSGIRSHSHHVNKLPNAYDLFLSVVPCWVAYYDLFQLFSGSGGNETQSHLPPPLQSTHSSTVAHYWLGWLLAMLFMLCKHANSRYISNDRRFDEVAGKCGKIREGQGIMSCFYRPPAGADNRAIQPCQCHRLVLVPVLSYHTTHQLYFLCVILITRSLLRLHHIYGDGH